MRAHNPLEEFLALLLSSPPLHGLTSQGLLPSPPHLTAHHFGVLHVANGGQH